MLLLLLVYYHRATPSRRRRASAPGAGPCSPSPSWRPFVYDALYKSPLGRNVRGAFVAAYALVAVAVFLYSRFAGFSYRGTLIHTGSMFGTIMAWNVWYRIWPAQQKIIRAVKEGTAPDADLVKLAGQRSRHNTYMSVPLLYTMVGQHTTFFAGGNWGIGERPGGSCSWPSSASAGTSSSSSTRGARRSRGSDPGPGRSTMAKPEPEPDPRLAARNQKLNVLFALSSLGLLAAIGLMVRADYDREWRQHQVEFNRLSVALTKEQIEKALSPEDAQRLREVEARARAGAGGGGGATRRDPEGPGEIDALQAEWYAADQDFRFTKAKLDVARYELDEAVALGERERARPAGRSLRSSSGQWEEYRLAVEDLVARRDAGKARLAELRSARSSRRRRRAPRCSRRRPGSRTSSGGSSPGS